MREDLTLFSPSFSHPGAGRCPAIFSAISFLADSIRSSFPRSVWNPLFFSDGNRLKSLSSSFRIGLQAPFPHDSRPSCLPLIRGNDGVSGPGPFSPVEHLLIDFFFLFGPQTTWSRGPGLELPAPPRNDDQLQCWPPPGPEVSSSFKLFHILLDDDPPPPPPRFFSAEAMSRSLLGPPSFPPSGHRDVLLPRTYPNRRWASMGDQEEWAEIRSVPSRARNGSIQRTPKIHPLMGTKVRFFPLQRSRSCDPLFSSASRSAARNFLAWNSPFSLSFYHPVLRTLTLRPLKEEALFSRIGKGLPLFL